MTKYSTELKIEIVSKYLNHEDSIKGLAKQYNIHWTLIRRWVDKAKCQGLAALSVKHTKTTYSSDFRLNVVRYYLTHSIGVSKVVILKYTIGLKSSMKKDTLTERSA